MIYILILYFHLFEFWIRTGFGSNRILKAASGYGSSLISKTSGSEPLQECGQGFWRFWIVSKFRWIVSSIKVIRNSIWCMKMCPYLFFKGFWFRTQFLQDQSDLVWTWLDPKFGLLRPILIIKPLSDRCVDWKIETVQFSNCMSAKIDIRAQCIPTNKWIVICSVPIYQIVRFAACTAEIILNCRFLIDGSTWLTIKMASRMCSNFCSLLRLRLLKFFGKPQKNHFLVARPLRGGGELGPGH